VSVTSTFFRKRSTQGLLPLPEIVPVPIMLSVLSVSQHFSTQVFSSDNASAVSRFDITAIKSSRVSHGLHHSSSYGLHPDPLSDNPELLHGATSITRSDAILLSFTPPSGKADTKVHMPMKDAASKVYPP